MTVRSNLVLLSATGLLGGGCAAAPPAAEEPEIPVPVIVVSAPAPAPSGQAELAEAEPEAAPDEEDEEDEPEEDAVEFGMIGLLNAGGQAPPWGSGTGGLGLSGSGSGPPAGGSLGPQGGGPGAGSGGPRIGSLSQGSGLGTGQGYGSGSGRAGSSARTRPPQVRLGATQVSSGLPPEVIQRIVRQNFGRFRLCYEAGLQKDPKLQGKVTVRFTITKDGAVTAVSSSGSLKDTSVIACVARAFHGLTFPKPSSGPVVVSYPLVFNPS